MRTRAEVAIRVRSDTLCVQAAVRRWHCASTLLSSSTMAETRASSPPYPHGAVGVGTRLGEFEVKRVLGVGGFGIVYLAFDHLLEREVALKEYMPASLVERSDELQVTLISQAHADTFALGLRSFVNEARLLARFDHPSLVKVHRFWEANGTAYMAMALYKGRTARDVRTQMTERPDEAWVRRLLEPLLGAIEKLHSEDVYHRDIAPDNILIEADGRPVLLDFGAARRVITDRSQALTAILKPSYAPIEQYADVSGMKQGPWTDIYALGATVHYLLMGKPPPP
ncbi:MAG: serine/threonine protein kinase, partial [Rubrivivax sp.]|nr:serine/threonine protein kinase [Rubrivivax sp.]